MIRPVSAHGRNHRLHQGVERGGVGDADMFRWVRNMLYARSEPVDDTGISGELSEHRHQHPGVRVT